MPRRRSILVLLIVLALFFGAIKVFTEEATLRDDPTVALRIHLIPSFQNFVAVDTLEQPGHIVLMTDENELVFGDTYRWIVGWGWIAAFVLTIGYGFLTRRR